MRNRIVVWGRNAQEDRVLIAVELLMEQNIVKIQTFTEKDVSDEVYKTFMDKWRKNQECELPEPHKVWARELSVSEGLLPEELKVEQSDMINRAQTEWHYMVLSAKLKESYRAEIAEINDRVDRKGEYDSNLWSQLKTFWEKVQTQLRDKTFLREHGNEIREEVDGVFAKMKELRDKMNEEVKEKSAEAVTLFANKLESIDKKIEEGTHLRRVFDELRQLQNKFHETTFSRDDRKMIYDKIDAAFKSVKAKRNGDGGGNAEADSAANRTSARYEGLLKAMEKMQRSIGRDEKDLEFEHRRIANTNGQLEAEMRKAKIKMIDSRVVSKREKLDDMEKTKSMLEGRMKKHEQRKAKDAKRQAEREAAAAVKAKMAAEMKAKKADMSDEDAAKLAAAAAAIKAGKQKSKGKVKESVPAQEENALIAAAVAVSEIVSGTPEAAAPVVETPPVVEAPAETVVEAIATAPEVVAEVVAEEEKSFMESAGEFIESATEKLTDVVEDVVDTAKAVAEVAGNKLSEAVEELKEEVKEISGEEE